MTLEQQVQEKAVKIDILLTKWLKKKISVEDLARHFLISELRARVEEVKSCEHSPAYIFQRRLGELEAQIKEIEE